MIKKSVSILPGVGVAVGIAGIATLIEYFLPIHLIGASIIALFIGMAVNNFIKAPVLKDGLKFTSKKILRIAIILMGASLSIQTVIEVGRLSLIVMVFTLFACFGVGYFVGKALKLNWKVSNLISAGTGICGASAIAAISPVIDAEDKDVAYAMSATFIFDMAMVVLFPIMGAALGMSDMAYGLWAGTAVNDTSSVVAAGFAYSEGAGDFATMVKLTRTLSIIPVVLIFAAINIHIKRKERMNAAASAGGEGTVAKNKVSILSLFPWFIVGFLALAALNSAGVIPAQASVLSKEASKFLMVCALAAIGMNTNFGELRKSGKRPMIHGFTISLLVVLVALGVEMAMGLV